MPDNGLNGTLNLVRSFWTAASLADILRRFRNLNKPIQEFPDCTFQWACFIIPCSQFTSCCNPTQ